MDQQKNRLFVSLQLDFDVDFVVDVVAVVRSFVQSLRKERMFHPGIHLSFCASGWRQSPYDLVHIDDSCFHSYHLHLSVISPLYLTSVQSQGIKRG